MKKIFCVVLVVLLALSLASCGSKYSSPSFDDFFGADFNWDMSVNDAVAYIESHQINTAEIDVNKGSSSTLVTDDYYIFRFDKNGKMEFVKLKIGLDDGFLQYLVSEYGKYDKKDFMGDDPDDPFYTWYGTMAGKRTQMIYEIDSVFDCCYIEFTCKE